MLFVSMYIHSIIVENDYTRELYDYHNKEIIDVFTSEGSVVLGGTAEQFKVFMATELKKNELIVKAAGITAN